MDARAPVVGILRVGAIVPLALALLLAASPRRAAEAARGVTLELGWVQAVAPGAPERTHPLRHAAPAGTEAPPAAIHPHYVSLRLADNPPLGVAVDVGAEPPVVWIDGDADGRFDPTERLEVTSSAAGHVARFTVDLAYRTRDDVLPCEIELAYRPRAPQEKRLVTRAQAFRRAAMVVEQRVRRVALVDGNGDMRFDDAKRDYVLVDQDADGQFDASRRSIERSSLGEPVRIGRTAYRVQVDTADGGRIRMVASAAHVAKGTRPSPSDFEPVGVEQPTSTPPERMRALAALRTMRHPAALDLAAGLVGESALSNDDAVLLVRVLSESGAQEHSEALLALHRRIGLPDAIRERIVRSLAHVRNPRITKQWVEMLGDPSRRMRVVAIRLLAQQPDAAAVRALVAQGAREDDARVLDALIDALAARPSAVAAGFLIDAAKRGGAKREVAVRALGRIGFGVPGVRAFFGRLLASRSAPERLLALDLVARSKDIGFCPRVAPSLEHPSWEVRQAATEALATLRCHNSVSALIARMPHEPRRRMRMEMGQALYRLTGVYFYEDAARWTSWWEAQRASFQFPTETFSLPSGAGDTTEGFYGLPLDSDHVLFLIDRSGSMSTVAESATGATRWEVATREVRRAARPLGAEGRAGVLLFAGEVRAWQPRLQRMSKSGHARLGDWLERHTPGGGTNLFDALARAYAYADADTIFIVSDGLPSAGRYRSPHQVLRAFEKLASGRRIRVHCVSVGTGSRLLRRLAEMTGGRYARQ